MRKIKFALGLSILISVIIFSCNKEAETGSKKMTNIAKEGKYITYYMDLYSPDLYGIDEKYIKEYQNNYSDANRDMRNFNNGEFFIKLIDLAKAGKLEVYAMDNMFDKNNPFQKKLSVEEVNKIAGNKYDTLELEDLETGLMEMRVVSSEFYPEVLESAYFIEEWAYQEDKNKFIKKVVGIVPLSSIEIGMEVKKQPLFLIKLKEGNIDIAKKVKSNYMELNLTENIYVHNAYTEDSLINLDANKLVDIAVNKALNKKLKCYEVDALDITKSRCSRNIEEKIFGEILKDEEFKAIIGTQHDTLDVENLETGKMEQKITERRFEKESLKRFLFYEKWYLSEDGIMQKEILGMIPLKERILGKDIKAYMPLYIVRFE